MKEKKMANMSTPKDGVFQMLNGNIDSRATFISQYVKPAKWVTEKIRD